jgi:nicotinamide-nucleotide amidase
MNTNAGWLGAELSAAGIRPVRVLTIGDDRPAILRALREADTHVVLITGGLGPTRDDITKQVLCEFFGTRLVRRTAVEARIVQMFRATGRQPLEVNLAQADLPESCHVVPNERGTASGMWFDHLGRDYISMPGVPYEMRAMTTAYVLPELVRQLRPPAIMHRTILTTGLGESRLAQRIAAWEDSLAEEGITLAYLPSPGLVKLRLSIHGHSAREARERVDRKAGQLHRLIPEFIYGEGDERLEEVVGRLLKERGATLSLAESCTGGMVSSLVTGVPGSSAYYVGGVVSYANAVKMIELGIPADMLELEGAVSRPVVEQMAVGVRGALRTTWSVATSGVAGPDGGTPDKPVGTVWMAVAGPDGVHSIKGNFPGTRDLVIRRSAMAALDLLRKSMLALPMGKAMGDENI